MKDNKFSNEELIGLCSLFMEGKLTKEEENALYIVLSQEAMLPEECESILKVMQAERNIFKEKTLNKKLIKLSTVAAAVLALAAIGLPFFCDVKYTDKNENCVVWQDGKKITGEEAKQILEENQRIDMEMIRQLMRQQREMMKQNFGYVNMDDYDF